MDTHEPESAQPDETATARSSKQRRSWRSVLGWALIGLAVVEGIALTLYLLSARSDRSAALPAPTYVATTAQEAVAAATTTTAVVPGSSAPLLIGLGEERAIEILTDVGVPPDSVAIEERPWIQPAGVVIDQQPAAGEALTDSMILTISTTAETPDLLATTQQAAERELAGLGAAAQLNVAYRPGAQPGTVVQQAPSAGSALSPVVALTLAAAPAELYVTELDYVDRESCDSRERRTDGIEFERNLRCSTRVSGSPASIDYDLGRDYESFRAVIGVSDEAEDTGAEFEFRLIGDNEVLLDTVVGFGQSETVDIDVAGVLRLTFEVIAVAAADESRSNDAVWGNPLLKGDPAVVSAARGS